MKHFTWVMLLCLAAPNLYSAEDPMPFGKDFPSLDNAATGEWWTRKAKKAVFNLNVPRNKVVAFALYTHHRGVLKLSAQLYPLMPTEAKEVRLEFLKNGQWELAATEKVLYPGWSAHFRIEKWDSTQNVPYRVRHGEKAVFEGLIRKDPGNKPDIVVGVLSCNSSRTDGPRAEIVENLTAQDPDLLFFAGDQSYHHTQHTAGWLEFGIQFREIMKDRPTITIPDDHDVGQANIWGENGKVAANPAGANGGYYYPVSYVNMVQRCQTWHLPDPFDPKPIERGISVYYTSLLWGEIDFAILEDRKFKSGPEGKIPKMGPRPDHINDEKYDPKTVDLPTLELLGNRQMKFLEQWSQKWAGAKMKSVLSQTAFCGAVHMHGGRNARLLADLDCNGWPQTGRNEALKAIRRTWSTHLCGDQHLAVLVKHGIDEFDDGPYAFTTPAIVNTIYGRWWHPKDEKAGPNAVPGSPLPWTGNFRDGLGNRITMLAYANPANVQDEKQRGDGYGIVRFQKKSQNITFECWPRFAKVSEGDTAQYPGWPMTVKAADNDGRKVTGYLPTLEFKSIADPVVQVIDNSSKEIIYTIRIAGKTFSPKVYANSTYTIRWGKDLPENQLMTTAKPGTKDAAKMLVE
ncbi:MAG: hypothetical protein R3B84_13600 [Zavarzinella sp.]